MTLNITQVDAFTDQPFAGNPAAVCVLPEPASEQWMQSLAQEMNLSETAFLYKQDDGYNLRWFTPAIEVELCGHATLASAHVIWSEGHLPEHEEARFYTKSGLLQAQRKGDWIELNFPATPERSVDIPPGLVEALGVEPKYVGTNGFYYLAEIDSEQTLRQMQPNFMHLKTLPFRGIMVTSLADTKEYDFVSRFFAPAAGIDEDPVTGSAHCCLGPFWRDRLDKDEFLAYQASARGGVIRVRCSGDRIYLGGQAVTVMRGELYTPI